MKNELPNIANFLKLVIDANELGDLKLRTPRLLFVRS
jgi:hypothetical protein